MPDRSLARTLAREHLARNDPTGWFDQLYRSAAGDAGVIPWADLAPNPHLIEWMTKQRVHGEGETALVIGCGLGDDAEALSATGFVTTAFDISPTAIDWCRRRFPRSKVTYEVADVLAPPPSWKQRFNFIFEAYTLQALPPPVRAAAIPHIAALLTPAGTLLVICRGRDDADPIGEIPWPLSRSELDQFTREGLTLEEFDDFMEPGDEAPVRRFRAVFRR